MMIGHNSKLSEEQNKTLFMDCVSKDMAIGDKIKALQAERKSSRKIFQSYGYAVHEIEFASKAIEAEDKARVTGKHSNQAQILHWLGLMPGYQADLFSDRSTGEEKIRSDGERVGWRNGKRESGYSDASNENKVWLEGFDAAQAKRNEHLASTLEQIKANSGAQTGDTTIVKRSKPKADKAPSKVADLADEKAKRPPRPRKDLN